MAPRTSLAYRMHVLPAWFDDRTYGNDCLVAEHRYRGCRSDDESSLALGVEYVVPF